MVMYFLLWYPFKAYHKQIFSIFVLEKAVYSIVI